MAYGDRTIWIGYDDREFLPFAVARHSMRQWCEFAMPVRGIVMDDLIERGWYTRPTSFRTVKRKRIMWDDISGAPMSTQFSISRFFILEMAKLTFPNNGGWALFTDCDVLVRNFIDDVFFAAEQQPDKALVCVPHQHKPTEDDKKDGVPQLKEVDSRAPGVYSRKNWSSVMLMNRDHPTNKALTLELLNSVPGRDLHRFCWLEDQHIGELDIKWNHLAGVDGSRSDNPTIVHFTNGGPWLPRYSKVEYAEEWRKARDDWVRS